MAEYTPTTEQVREAWASRYDGEHSGAVGDERRGYEAEFSRWLAAHDREVKAEALGEAAARYREAEKRGYVCLEGCRVPWEEVARDLDRLAAEGGAS